MCDARRKSTQALAIILVACALAGCAGAKAARPSTGTVKATTAGPGSSAVIPTLTIDRPSTAEVAASPISPLLLGANGHWFDQDDGGWDPQSQSAYPAFVRALARSGVTSVRYPSGTAANLYQWQRAIGPPARRTPQVGLSSEGFTAPEDDDFGPEEFGALSQRLGQPGDILVNFATATPTNAAEEVDFLTGRVGAERIDGVDWAALRARDGHPAPFDLPYWEVGNEAGFPQQYYWRAGQSADSPTELYAFGGSTTFVRQLVGTSDDYRNSAALSSGDPSQRFQVRYPPIAPGTARLYVDGATWTASSDLADAPAGADVYSLDDSTGQITFGDGDHGAIPPPGASVSISYTSGPHAGFTSFYAAMKRANPRIHVCVGLSDLPATDEFIAMMGSRPYDCIQYHAYIGLKSDPIPPDESPADYYERVLAAVPAQVTPVSQIEHAIDGHPDARARHVGVAVTEYGQEGDPRGDPTFQQSLAQAIFMADDLIAWMQLGVPEADKANLNAFLKGAQPDGEAVPGQTGQDAMILRASPTDFVLTPTGELPALVRPLTGGELQSTTVTPNPSIPSPGGQTLRTLQTAASRQPDGELALLVVNQRPARALSARIEPGISHGAHAEVSTLDGPALTSINAPDGAPVTVRNRSVDVGTGDFTYSFPAHSITRIVLTPTH